MQDVPNSQVPLGAEVVGHVLDVRPAINGHSAELSFRFDSVRSSKRLLVNTDLRALASLIDVADAETPLTGADCGTPWRGPPEL